jgi:hypothetical protein
MKTLIGGGLCLQHLVDDDRRHPPHTRYYKMGWRPIEVCRNVYEGTGQILAFYIHRPLLFIQSNHALIQVTNPDES